MFGSFRRNIDSKILYNSIINYYSIVLLLNFGALLLPTKNVIKPKIFFLVLDNVGSPPTRWVMVC